MVLLDGAQPIKGATGEGGLAIPAQRGETLTVLLAWRERALRSLRRQRVFGKRTLRVEPVVHAERPGKLAVDKDRAAGLAPSRPELVSRDQAIDDRVEHCRLAIGEKLQGAGLGSSRRMRLAGLPRLVA